MEDHIEISHFTKFDSFRVNRDKVLELETWFKKSIQKSLILRQCGTLKNGQTCVIFFSACHKTEKKKIKKKSLIWFWGTLSQT